jgi:glyoxalase family protein
MSHLIPGIHHVTATVGESLPDLKFYAETLGLRLVKKTVNFDNRQVYHFYYGNQLGEPGTIMTTFPYAGQQVRKGLIGSGQVGVTGFSVPVGSLLTWEKRLQAAGVASERAERFQTPELRFKDPAGLNLLLIEAVDERAAWLGGGMGEAVAIRGFHSATLWVTELAPMADFMAEFFGWKLLGQEGDTHRFVGAEDLPGNLVDIRELPQLERGKNGLGTVHHLAFRIGSEAEQLSLREKLLTQGFRVTEVKDRKYFRSIYFRSPGGILFEVATVAPGFAVDESEAELGRELKLPEWEEPLRAEIEADLPEISPW